MIDLQPLQAAFGERLQVDAPLARYTSARIGGPAAALLEAQSADDLAEIAARLWGLDIPFTVLGGGSNVLVSDAGLQRVVVINRARAVRFDESDDAVHGPAVWAESGANFGALARQVAQRGFAGLEWAGSIPGTLGGAVVGNAGANGGDMQQSLLLAEILHHHPQAHNMLRESWGVERFQYSYRSSILKRQFNRPDGAQAVVLDAWLRLGRSTPEAVQAKMEAFNARRRQTQPPGASMGSMFKNPPGDYAGRLLEAAGLKGARRGAARISELHANFFVNDGQATAREVMDLIELARSTVSQKFGVTLDLEIEVLGEF